MQVEIKNGNLIVTIPMHAPQISATGKSYGVASSHGNKVTDAKVKFGNPEQEYPLSVGVNAYIKI